MGQLTFASLLAPAWIAQCSDKFDASWRAACDVQPCSIVDAEPFIRAHYLHKRPAVVMLCLLMRHRGWPVGCAVYSAPPLHTSIHYGGNTWELARLYLIDEIPRNAETWLIGKTVKYIKRNYADVEYLVSYADPAVGHAGTIYKAANWEADGDSYPGMSEYLDPNTGKVYGRYGHVPEGTEVIRQPRPTKHRFVLRLK